MEGKKVHKWSLDNESGRSCYSGATPEAVSEVILKGGMYNAKNQQQYNELIRDGFVPHELPPAVPCIPQITAMIGNNLRLEKGQPISLDRATYTRLASRRFVIPADSNHWHPDSNFIDDSQVKKLYSEEPKKNFVNTWPFFGKKKGV